MVNINELPMLDRVDAAYRYIEKAERAIARGDIKRAENIISSLGQVYISPEIKADIAEKITKLIDGAK